MTKPHSPAEPSMEDILASIRKMISEDVPEQRPMPDQMGRTPFGSDLSQAEEPARWEDEQPIEERVAASFSSLSEALKSAPPAGEPEPRPQTLSLEERIAGLLDKESAANASQPADPLSTFVARTGPGTPGPQPVQAPAAPSAPEAQRSALAREPAPQSAPPSNGNPLTSKLADLGQAVPQRREPLSVPRQEAKPAKEGAPLPFGTRSDAQRVISIPSRGPGAPAAAQNGAMPGAEAKNAEAKNGTSGSPFGLRPGGAPSTKPQPLSLQERLKEKIAAELPKSEIKPEPKAEDKAESKPEPVAAASESAAPVAAAEAPASATKPAPAGPSEALLDAVVDLVQKDPGSMSVFTSGSAFIHGVGDKPGEPPSQALVPVPGQRLDGAASELLRPMLRQWLAENMPRIVEEALRSELASGGSEEKDPKKS